MKRTLLALGLMGLLGAGCAPVSSSLGIREATIALSAATTAGAKDSAVYEYTAAREYLKKAREENAYADYAAARLFAEKALILARDARTKAELAARIDAPPPAGQ